MTDRREQVLAALFLVLQSVASVKVVVRNRGELPAAIRPAVVLLDGNETARDSPPQERGRLTAAPNLVDMSPEIYVVMDQRETKNDRIGETKYLGCDTDMASGRSMEGQLFLRFTFTYVLKPSEL